MREGRAPKRGSARRWGMRLFALLGVALAAWLLWRGLRRYSLDDVRASIEAIPASHLAFTALATAGSYLCLTGFDYLALAYLGKRLPYRKVMAASFISLSLGHSIGFAGLSSGPIRYRFYSHWGLSAADVTQLVLHCGVTVGLGLLALGGVALIASPDIAQSLAGLGRAYAIGAGVLALAIVAAYLLAAAFLRRVVTIRGRKIRMPSLTIAVGQVVIGAVNFSLVAAALDAAVSSAAEASYATVASVYVTANLATLLTHVPGGVGVIESTVMYALKGGGGLIGPLIAFRVIYFLVPLAIGAVLFLSAEIMFRRAARRRRSADA